MSRDLILNWQQRNLRLCCASLFVFLLYLLLWPAGLVRADTFTVTNTNDSGAGSLRQAMLDANNRAGVDVILFNLGAGVQTIKPTSALPTITDVVEINALSGGTCPTMPPQPRVELDGSLVGGNVDGFNVQAANSRIVGFYINRFKSDGVEINASDVVVACNVIGLTPQGAAAGNSNYGVKLNGNNNIIGRLGSLAGNVVSANFFGIVAESAVSGNIIRGNFIGTDINGSQDRGNDNSGIGIAFGASDTTIGGTSTADRNVISGNDTEGIWIVSAGSGNQVMGNFIGLNASGAGGLPNATEGILLEDSDDNTIGGTGNGQGNRIAFNTKRGVAIDSGSQNNPILGNEIFSNGELGIDLGLDGVTADDNGDGDSGANDLQNKPILSGAILHLDNRLETEAVLLSTPNTTFRIEFFASDSCDSTGFGEGTTFVGSAMLSTNSDGGGIVNITFDQAVPDGQQITATATNNSGNAPANTSEFSECVTVIAEAPPSAPQLQPDTATTQEDTPVTINVLGNDFRGAGGQPLVIVAVGNPTAGTAQIVDNQILYTPNPNFNGSDTFFYSAHNGNTANTRQTTVRVQVEAVSDGPSDILLDKDTVAEDITAGSVVGKFSAVDDGGGNFLTFSLVGTDNDNDAFSLFLGVLRVQNALDFETKQSYVIDVQVRNLIRQTFTKRFTIQVTDVNDAPTAITLSNSRIDENQAAGATVGTLSSTDVDAGDSHTYTLVDGSGSDDNKSFRIEGSTLKTNAVLDFEEKPIYSARIRSTDSHGASFEQFFGINLNNLPTPPDAIPNTLSYCSGDAITLFDNQASSAGKRVLVRIDNINISDKTGDSCTVNGKLTVMSNGSTVGNLTFSGAVNERNQFSSSSIPDFTINVAGVPLLARSVEINYVNERPNLHITRPALQMPKEFGGLSAGLSVPTQIDIGGLRFGTGTINLPTISTASGFEMSLSGRLEPLGDGFQIIADGSLSIPNIGKKKAPGSEGRTCTISAGVTISVNAFGQTVMAIAAGEAQTQIMTGPYLANAAPASLFAPDAFNSIRLSAVRAGASCNPGLPIGQTGLFLTSLSGEITVDPGNERVDVFVTIEAGKSLPVLGPILAMDGHMGLQPRPFQLDLGVALTMLSFEIARADATVTTSSFKTSIFFQGLFYNGRASITAFSRNGRATFTGSGRLAVEVLKGSFGEKCIDFGLLGEACSDIPPFSLGTLASVNVDVGEFTNNNFGFKGVLSTIFGSFGFFVDAKGTLAFGDVNTFRLVSGPLVAAARAALKAAQQNGQVVDAAALNQYIFLEDENGKSDGVIIRTPLVKPVIEGSQIQAAGATDVITQVNLLQHGDVTFNLTALAPLTFTVITPQGQEVTPANFSDSASLGYSINYTWTVGYQPVTGQELGSDDQEASLARLLFTPLSSDPAFNGVDLQIDGTTVYFNLNFEKSQQWLKPLPLTAGDHTVALVENGTSNVVQSTTVNVVDDAHYSLIFVGGPAADFVTIQDDTTAPATLGKAKLRFFNGAGTSLNMVVNDAPLFSNIAYKTASDYELLDAGSYNIEFRASADDALVAQQLTLDLADGGVYTFFSTEQSSDVFDITIVQRQDAKYLPTYESYYSVDQAVMNEEWQLKLVGDTDNIPYELAVWGPGSPPIVGSVTVDAGNPAAAQVSWQLTADNSPTQVTLYVNPGAISATIPITNSDGTTSTTEIPLFAGSPLAEFEISDLAELGGQLVTKQVDLSGLPSGAYHLWLRADDGVNAPVSIYAASPSAAAAGVQSVYGVNAAWIAKDNFNPLALMAGAAPIVIDHADDFPTTWTATISTTFDAATRSLYVEWQTNSHPDVDNYRLLFGNTPLAPTQVITTGGSTAEFDENGQATGVEVGFVTLQDIQPDVDYYLSIEAVDTAQGRAVRSQEVLFTVAAASFTLTSAQQTVAVDAGDTATVPVTLSASEALFFPNVWLSTNLGGAAAGITANFVDDNEGINELNSGKPTRMLAINVDASVPSGTYPIVITGYNGDAKEALTLQVVVDNPNGNPTVTNTVYLPLIRR